MTLIGLIILCVSQQCKETPTQVFSCESYEIFKNSLFIKHLQCAALVNLWNPEAYLAQSQTSKWTFSRIQSTAFSRYYIRKKLH